LTTSYVGRNAADLLDVVLNDRGYDPSRVVSEALPNPRLGRKTTMLPVYKTSAWRTSCTAP
jgi:hypothetical protein